jgi:hypothetical protein
MKKQPRHRNKDHSANELKAEHKHAARHLVQILSYDFGSCFTDHWLHILRDNAGNFARYALH